MKKLSFLFLTFFLALTNLSAQDIVFTFNAKDASNTIDSIKATKVETGETAFVEGSNTINMSSFTTGTKLSPTNSGEISVYPNPFENGTHLKIFSNQNDNIKVSLINAAGQVVAEKSQNITPGIHQFNISTNNNGLYILNVTGNKTKFSQKIISSNNNRSLNKIEYNGYSSMSPTEKSAKIEGSELIHFYVYSSDNITKIADSLTVSKTYEVEFHECKDADGKSYPIVQIGEQWWMAENLAYLPKVYPSSSGSLEESRYYVNDFEDTIVSSAKQLSNYFTYGVLYNWTAALAACPSGWHLPSIDEWEQLSQFISDQNGGYTKNSDGWFGVGTHLKATSGWFNGNGTDDYGFSGLPSGYRYQDGDFSGIGGNGYWWSSTEGGTNDAWGRNLYYNNTKVYQTNFSRESGFSVRCVKDETNPEENKKPTSEEYLEITNNLEIQQKAGNFINMLKNATIQFNDSSKLTIFVVIDNPYLKDAIADEESYLKNHIVKGTYHLIDFGPNTELTAINGNKITIQNVDPKDNFYFVNNSVSCELDEVEINGNIVHYIYSPVFTNETDYSNYLAKTKEIFSEFIEYSYCFDAVLTDASDAINSSWIEIDNYNFNASNEKIEKLWFDAYFLLNRIMNLKIYKTETGSDIFSENSLFQSAITSILMNYFGGIPIYEDPTQFNNQSPRATEEEVLNWTIFGLDQAEYWATKSVLKNATFALKARTYFQHESIPNFTQARILCDKIINTGSYDLESNPLNVYSSINNPENIFAVNNSKKINSEISNQKNVLPICRLSETYLTSSYCGIKEGRMTDAMNRLNFYQEKKGFEISVFDPSVLNEKLKEYWLSEFSFDGLRFAILKKFDLTSEILGLPDYMKLLPIPMKEIVNNPSITQNPGY